MTKFLRYATIFLIGFFTCIIGITVFIFFLANSFTTKTEVKNGSYLLFDFHGEISERPISNNSLFSQNNHIQLRKIVNSIKNAVYDDKILGIIILSDVVMLEGAHRHEIMQAMEEFKRSGKKIYAWLSSVTDSSYMLSTIADEIYMPDNQSSDITLHGYSITIPYLKDFFEKFGISVSVLHTGDYKGTGENYILNNMSDELDSQYSIVFNSLYEQKISTIATNRNIDKKIIKSKLSNGSLTGLNSKDALAIQIVDGLKTYDEMLDYLFLKGDHRLISIYDYSSLIDIKKTQSKIAVIYIEGTITNYYSGSDYSQGTITGAKSIQKIIETIKKDSSYKGVIVRVNSPGGSALGSDLILRDLLKLKETKPVYISMGPYAASGGYYVSLSGSKIYANPITITGSIGVVSMFFNAEKLLESNGIHFQSLKKHPFDDMFSLYREPSSEEIQLLQKQSNDIYNEFTSHIIKERNISAKTIPLIANGRIWSGEQAIKNKLVDEIGTLEDVIKQMRIELNEGELMIDDFPKAPTFFELLMQGNMSTIASLFTHKDSLINQPLLKRIQSIKTLYLGNNSKPLVYNPYLPIESVE